MDETYIKIKGQWKYLYRAVDKEGNTIDFLLTAKRDKKAALRFFKKAIGANGLPEKVNMDKSGANKAGLEAYNEANDVEIEIRQNKYLNNRSRVLVQNQNTKSAELIFCFFYWHD
ncbi:Integrase catalytic region [Candidatus Thiomargarita nelsonii]|uniref:Integrase catalytic region n=1 Tax=Candidatus Thiomargarita nelsonii TaxID=1003181 RepID=A0A176S5F7_9GAMM|nr:Integrase catalytic region [Candidatus Thiomargarita nelsonii]